MRQTHRWTSIAFTATVIPNIVVMSGVLQGLEYLPGVGVAPDERVAEAIELVRIAEPVDHAARTAGATVV